MHIINYAVKTGIIKIYYMPGLWEFSFIECRISIREINYKKIMQVRKRETKKKCIQIFRNLFFYETYQFQCFINVKYPVRHTNHQWYNNSDRAFNDMIVWCSQSLQKYPVVYDKSTSIMERKNYCCNYFVVD